MKTDKAVRSAAAPYPDLMEIVHQIGPVLSQYGAEERQSRRLSRPVVDALRDAGLFRLFMPISLGGFEVDPLTTANIVEEISRYSTAAGWMLMVANTSRWWCSRLGENGIFFSDNTLTSSIAFRATASAIGAIRLAILAPIAAYLNRLP